MRIFRRADKTGCLLGGVGAGGVEENKADLRGSRGSGVLWKELFGN